MVEYIYDGLGDRVAKGNISSFSCDQTSNGFTATSNYIYGADAQQLAEYDGSGNIVHENVHQGGNLLATYSAGTSKWLYAFNDWLGTKRAQVGPDGSTNFLGFTSLPYGDNLSMSGLSATEDHFTGKDRDQESGNDYFGARYYSSKVGRFMSPDWSAKEDPVPYSDLFNPQSLNLYSYVNNNPLSKADPDGHCAEDFCIVEGGVSAYFLGAAAIVGVAAVLHTPAGQRSVETFTSAAGASLTANFHAASQLAQNIFSSKNPEAGAATAGAKGAVETAEETNKEAEKLLGSGAATGAAAEKLGEHVADQVKGIAATQAAVATLAGAKGKDATQKALNEVKKQTDLLKGHAKDIAQQINKIKKDQ